METFPWKPDRWELLKEEPLYYSKVPFGSGYAQVSYKGIEREWRIEFSRLSDSEMHTIEDWINKRVEFLWTQPPPHEADSAQRTHAALERSKTVDDVMTELGFIFKIELIGLEFSEQARQKFVERDTGLPPA